MCNWRLLILKYCIYNDCDSLEKVNSNEHRCGHQSVRRFKTATISAQDVFGLRRYAVEYFANIQCYYHNIYIKDLTTDVNRLQWGTDLYLQVVLEETGYCNMIGMPSARKVFIMPGPVPKARISNGYLPCVPGFVLTDYKSQSRTMGRVLLGAYMAG